VQERSLPVVDINAREDALGHVDGRLLDELLSKTSRTFALAIPMLPEPTRREVSIAYLLLRVADTIEDAVRWAPTRRALELKRYSVLLGAPSEVEARRMSSEWLEERPLDEPGYLELVAQLPAVVSALSQLTNASRQIVVTHVRRTCGQMAVSIEKMDVAGRLEHTTREELLAYCHAVAGIVGTMLTELFVLERRELLDVAPSLRERANTFGEGLQLVNILKDAASDVAEGRCYLPSQVDPADVFALARSDLETAREYVLLLAESETDRGLVEFTALITMLASATLAVVERRGPGAKLSRQEVAAIVERLHAALDRDPLGRDLFAQTSTFLAAP
jgi:farnesyl-diphosphate farnesyltransferase